MPDTAPQWLADARTFLGVEDAIIVRASVRHPLPTIPSAVESRMWHSECRIFPQPRSRSWSRREQSEGDLFSCCAPAAYGSPNERFLAHSCHYYSDDDQENRHDVGMGQRPQGMHQSSHSIWDKRLSLVLHSSWNPVDACCGISVSFLSTLGILCCRSFRGEYSRPPAVRPFLFAHIRNLLIFLSRCLGRSRLVAFRSRTAQSMCGHFDEMVHCLTTPSIVQIVPGL